MQGGISQGAQVGSYVIDSILGRGGMGVVYKAYHPRLARWAAIKVLPSFVDSPEAQTRFEREARAIAKLRHRHILSVFDYGEFNGQPYMVVEFMPSGSLLERMPKQPLNTTQAVSLLRPLAEALDYAHAQGILHRDVKPANVFLDAELQPVLADFGLAQMHDQESLTATGMVSGTPTHISPEQATGQPLSGATDQYALGIMAFQVLAAELPFQGSDVMGLLYAHVNAPVPSVSQRNPQLNPMVDRVLAKALAKKPHDRYPTCTEFVNQLEAAGAGRVDERTAPRPPAVPAGAVVEPPISDPAPMATPAQSAAAASAVAAAEPSAQLPRGRRRWPAALAGLALVLIVAAALYSGLVKLPALGTPAGGGGTPQPTDSASAANRFVNTDPAPPLSIGKGLTVSGQGLQPSRPAQAGFIQGGIEVHPISDLGLTVAADGSFTGSGIVPPELKPGSATLVACNFDAAGKPITASCIQRSITLR
ncbi:MAG TPA: serine/threonine-protein kinase [Candidatus Dormibacteraeota bacterium]